MNYKKILGILGISLLLLSSCSKDEVSVQEESTITITDSMFGVYDDADLITTWNQESAISISLNETSIISNSNAVNVNGTQATITTAGVYYLTGTLTDGQIIVDANKDTDTVRLIFDNVNINNNMSAPIYIKSADKTIITLASGSENTLTDTSNYDYVDTVNEEPSSTIFSKDDLTINGAGTLNIVANFNNAIQSKDDLVITSGTYHITSANNGIKGKDSISILDGTFTINSEGDAIQASNIDDVTKGWIGLDGGIYNLTTQNDGIQAETDLKISAGVFTIQTGNGYNSSATDMTRSYKGLKATNSIITTGGDFILNTLDDAIHTNGTIEMQAGTFTIDTGDDGIHADDTLHIIDGTINIQNAYEGLEAMNVMIDDGMITIVSSDDGINAVGGSDGVATGGMFGQDNFGVASGEYYLTINGGTIIINANGDGIDSNKDITMNGGSLTIFGPSDDGNSAIDCDGTFNMNSGTLLAIGSAGMVEVPSTTSGQPTISFYFNNMQAAGSTITLKASDTDTTIFEETSPKNFQNIVFSSDNFSLNSNYDVYRDGEYVTTVTLSAQIVSVSESGEVSQGNMFGGFGGQGPGGAGGQAPR